MVPERNLMVVDTMEGINMIARNTVYIAPIMVVAIKGTVIMFLSIGYRMDDALSLMASTATCAMASQVATSKLVEPRKFVTDSVVFNLSQTMGPS
mmetsp:Transcript_955/g.2285  ORF Transcript_955/g.2285 Transcript_955/m.2285 type:complete len:95 (+) Transcript_955:962-1246(+)